MRFHNANDVEMRFQLGARDYVVPSMHSVEVPDELEYSVIASGLRLARGPSPKAGAPIVGGERHVPARIGPPRIVREEQEIAHAEDPDLQEYGDEPEPADEAVAPEVQSVVEKLAASGVELPGVTTAPRPKRRGN